MSNIDITRRKALRKDVATLELNSFPVPYCNEKKKTNTQIKKLVKEIKILRT